MGKINEPYGISKEYLRELNISEENIDSYYKKLSALRERINPGIEQRPPDKEFYLKCTDGAKIFIQKFIPNAPKAIILFQHGHTIHSDIIYPLADYLYAKNIGIIAVDNRGHGRSGPGRGVFDKPELIFPIYRYLLLKYPGVPKHVYGESLGCTMMASFLNSEYAKDLKIDSFIMQVPPFQIKNVPSLQPMAFPIKILSEIIHVLSLGKCFFFSKPEIKDSYYKEFRQVDFFDPIKVYVITAKDLQTAASLIIRFPKHLEKITIPTLILEGTEDKTVEPDGAYKIYKTIQSKHKKVIMYKGADHSLFNDINSHKIYEDVLNWINRVNSLN